MSTVKSCSNKNFLIADIIRVILIISAIFFALIFPIFVSVFAIFRKGGKSLAFEAYIYGMIRVFKGSILQRGGFFIVKHTFKKAEYIPVYDIFTFKKSVKPLNDYHIISLRSLTETGISGDAFLPIIGADSFAFINGIAGEILTANKPYLKIRNDLNLYENENRFNVFVKTVVVFNLLMVILSVIKILTGKLFYAIGKSK